VPNDKGQYAAGMKCSPQYLKRTGYRLPTEAEWEYACRANSRSAYFFGTSEELLDSYCWNPGNARGRTWAVGTLKPNDLGLFDVHGNAWQWCHQVYAKYPNVLSEVGFEAEWTTPVRNADIRVLRGGAFDSHPMHLRSAFRFLGSTSNPFVNYGFRPARTLR
jgi:formylglycine-generating enzyme required for sulfatase activity